MFAREISKELLGLTKAYRVVTITGPRQCGKTTLTRMVFPDYDYVNLEEPDIRHLAQSDPRRFFSTHSDKLIIDEIQRVPELLSYVQSIVDEKNILGQFILTGSHQLALNQAISQSLAGRTALLSLYPLSLSELKTAGVDGTTDKFLLEGFMPQVHAQSMDPMRFYRNYFQTYVERDVRLMVNVKDMALFETFVRLCAGRIGQLLNANALSNEVGVNTHTIAHWLSILEASFVIVRLQPYFENLGKRLVKAPKLYFVDVGLASYLLGIETIDQLRLSPFRGNLFENMVVLELIKSRANQGRDPNLYFYRDSNGNEVDVLYKHGHLLTPIEIKSAQTFDRSFQKGILYFQKIAEKKSGPGYIIYAGDIATPLESAKLINFKSASQITQGEPVTN
jgi:predicted AAA+ superfamily ATPase